MSAEGYLEIFYDGSCPFCASVKTKLARIDKNHDLMFADLSRDRYVTELYGIPTEEALSVVHAVDHEGRIYKGYDVFVAALRFTGHRKLAFLANLPGILQLGRLVYKVFLEK